MTTRPRTDTAAEFKRLLGAFAEIRHLTIEVHACPTHEAGAAAR